MAHHVIEGEPIKRFDYLIQRYLPFAGSWESVDVIALGGPVAFNVHKLSYDMFVNIFCVEAGHFRVIALCPPHSYVTCFRM